MTDQHQPTPPPATPPYAPQAYAPRPSADMQAMMAYDAQKKSMTTAVLLWVFLGGVGAHNFYLGRTGPAVGQLLLNIFSWVTLIFIIGIFGLIALGIWLIVDICMLSGIVRQHNAQLAQRMGMAMSVY